MTPITQMTRAQEQRFYRHAVQASLEQFYRIAKPEASRLVRNWWKRLSESGALNSELFLHSEPINTAAGIAEMSVIPITSRNRETYHRILDQSRDLVLAQAKPKPTHQEHEPQKRAAQQLEPLVHFATSSTSNVVRGGVSVKALAKKVKARKTTTKQQVAFS